LEPKILLGPFPEFNLVKEGYLPLQGSFGEILGEKRFPYIPKYWRFFNLKKYG